jgi:ribosomal protein S12 methylthiotransferase accessory factor YcaO
MTRPNPAVATIWALLDAQKQALLAGDLATLDRLPETLSRAMDQLAQARPDTATLQNLSEAAARNARLVQSARDGLARVRRDMAPAAPLTTYDAHGRQRPAADHGQLIARR